MRALIAVLLLSSAAHAQDIQTLPPGADSIVPLRMGQAAPFDGQLFSTETALRWGFWLQQYKVHLKLDVDTALKTCAVNQASVEKIQDLQLDANQKIQADLQARLLASEKARLVAEDEARNPPWYRSREFGVVTGVVGSVVIFALSVSVIHATSK